MKLTLGLLNNNLLILVIIVEVDEFLFKRFLRSYGIRMWYQGITGLLMWANRFVVDSKTFNVLRITKLFLFLKLMIVTKTILWLPKMIHPHIMSNTKETHIKRKQKKMMLWCYEKTEFKYPSLILFLDLLIHFTIWIKKQFRWLNVVYTELLLPTTL